QPRDRHAFPDIVWSEVPQDRRSPANVIEVTVRQDKSVDRSDTELPQNWTDHPIAYVVTQPSAGIDKHGAPSRKADERGISLPYVDERHVQASIPATRRHRPWREGDPDPACETQARGTMTDRT